MNRLPAAALVLASIAFAAGCPAQPPAGIAVSTAPASTNPGASAAPSSGTGSPAPGPSASGMTFDLPPGTYASPGVVRYAGKDAPPWPVPADTEQRVKNAGLQVMPTEALTYHVHSHLDVFVNGQAVTVPGLIGIDPNGRFISPLHTHSTDGILHIEAPAKTDFKLSQAMTEWGVALDGFTAYVNGKQVPDATQVLLYDHEEIALVYGPAPSAIPSSNPFTGL